MKRLLIALLTAGTLGVVGLAQTPDTDEPAPRLKKKSKPAVVEPKPEDRKPAEDKLDPREEPSTAAAPAEGDEEEMLRRLVKNTRAAEERLTNREIGDGVRQIQDDILKDLDALIASQSQPEQPQGGGGQQNQQNQQQNQDNQGGQDQQPMGGQGTAQEKQPMGSGGQAGQPMQGGGQTRPGLPGDGAGQGGQQQMTRREIRKQRERERTQTARGSQPGSQGQQRPGSTGQGNNPSGDNPMGGQDSKTVGLPPREIDPRFDVWGHLDETERLKMNRYMDEKFMDKYDELTRQYYRTIAEKSRRKGN